MNKIVLMFALITMPFFSHADDWDETESCRVKLKDSFAIEAKYCDDCDTDDIKFYVRGKKDNTIELKEDVIYLKKEGNVNGNGNGNGNSKSVLYRLWSANDDVDGIFNEDEDHLDGDTVYTIRIEFNDIEKSGNSYTVNLSYFLYDGTTLLKPGIESRVEFDDLSNSSDVFFEQDEDLFDLNCQPSSRPEPNPDPEFSVPDNVCKSFPEPIQGWKRAESELIVTNSAVRALGWSPEYLADSQNRYTQETNGQSWQTLRIGFDSGGQAWQLYQNSNSKVCDDNMGCLPDDAEPGGGDGLVETRKANKPTPITESFNSGRDLLIRMKDTDANFYEKVCSSGSDACSFSETNGKVVIRLKRDLKSLDINGYNTNKTVELQLDGQRTIEEFVYDSGYDLSLYFSDNAELTVKTFRNKGSNPKLIFGSNVKFNVVGTNQPVGPVNSADFKLEDAHFDYRTVKDELILPVIYGPEASFHFKTDSGQVFKGFILAKSIMLDTSEYIYGAVTSLRLDMRGSTKIEKPKYPGSCWLPPQPQQCTLLPEENFNSGSLSNWSVMGFKGNEGNVSDPPVVSDQRFILNSNKQYQATASAYNYVFPSDQNYLEVEFDHYAYGGNGADGVALVISDASIPPKTGAFGGPLGYGMKLKSYPNTDVSEDAEGFAGGWLAVGIDEYGNFRREGGEQVTRNAVADNVVVRGVGAQDSQGKWLKGYPFITEKNFGGSLDGRNNKLHRYKVVLNSRNANTMTLAVFRKIGENGDWDRVIDEFDVLEKGGFTDIPENFRLSVTASTGYDTNTHAIDNFQVCADEYQKITNGIHHFEFEYAKTGSICQASDVILRACMNEACSEQYPRDADDSASLTPLSVTLSTSGFEKVATWVGGANILLQNEKQLELQGLSEGTVTLKVESSKPVTQSGFEETFCYYSDGSRSDCTITFAPGVLAVNVDDVVSSRETEGEDYLSFCANLTENQGESRDVKMSIYYDFAPVDNSQPVSITYKKKVGDNDPEWSSAIDVTTTDQDLPSVFFDNEGKAYFKLKYEEVGQVTLKASVAGSVGDDSFVSFPSKLKVTAKSGNKSGECTNSEVGCSGRFVAAGEVFELTISALQDDDSVAKNYQEETIVISNSVKYPSTGSSAKLLNEKLPESSQWSRGSVTFDQSVSDVGAFELKAQAPIATDENGDELDKSLYLGSNAFKIQDGNLTVGRFYPDYFKVTGTEWTYPDNQNQSVYMGQNFESVKFEVTAYNANGYTTQNYGGFANSLKADLYLAGGYSDRLSILDSDLESDNWSGAVWSKTWDNSVYWRKDLSLPSPDGPFNSKLPADKDSSIETSISLSLNNNGTKVSGYVDPTMFLKEGQNSTEDRMVSQQLLSQPDVRFGRIALDDVGVNQGKSVNIPLRVEYWRDNRFVLNSKDNGTTVSPTLKSQEPVWPDDGSDCDILLEGVRTTVNDGAMRELIAKQERADCGRQQAEVWLNLDPSGNNLPWLKYDWVKEPAGKAPAEENPSSVVTFGIHRGNDRVIYRGEPGLTGQ
ncbi:DUF6701 domain-containing protein [Vibrio sp. 945]|nr:DUF6701 domain-containing protein [Vibrio sp. 945]